MRKKNSHNKTRGSAIITALFIMTLVTITVSSLSAKLQLDIHNIKITINTDKLYLASQAVPFWAIEQLKNNDELKNLSKNGKILNFPTKFKYLYPGVTITGAIYDLQAKFNLNNLTNKAYQILFFRLLTNIMPNLKQKTKKDILEAVTNWVTEHNLSNTNSDMWLQNYLQQNPAYLPGYQTMQSVSELRSVYNINSAIYQKLLPYVTVIPEITPININTTPQNLLMSLGKDIKIKNIKSILTLRKIKPIRQLTEIEAFIKEFNIKESTISTNSSYFMVITKTAINDLTFISYTTLKRIKNANNTITIDIIKQTFNTE